MFPSSGFNRIYLYRVGVDLRKSFEGLSAIVQACFPGQLVSGSCFVFTNRRRTHMKILFWDSDGFVIWYKRLERGLFSVSDHKTGTINRRELTLIIEGIKPKRMNMRHYV
jgi:transposase